MSTSSECSRSHRSQTGRPVSLLTPDQLKKKRAQDRESQRQTRERVRGTIRDLESRVESLTQQLHISNLENAALRNRSNQCDSLLPTKSISSAPSGGDNFLGAPKAPELDGQLFSEAFILETQISKGNTILPTKGATSDGWQLDSTLGLDLLDPSLLTSAGFAFDEYPPPALCVQVWEARPVHIPATCLLDKIFFDIVESRTMFDVGANALEFSSPKFPSVAALLNPDQHSATLPLTTAVVSNVIYVLTVPSLPEQIAIMYVMCSMLRWQITGSKKDYDALPEWMRPGAAQLVTAHPFWVDVFPWPKAREQICQNFDYHHNQERFKTVCNQTISINWPYEPSDTLIAISDTEYIINPVFMTHMRNLENWTLGSVFVEAFPDLAKCVKVGRPRGHRQLS